jgi:hypothetical protein
LGQASFSFNLHIARLFRHFRLNLRLLNIDISFFQITILALALFLQSRVSRSVSDGTFTMMQEMFTVTLTNVSLYENYNVTVVAATSAGSGNRTETIVLGQRKNYLLCCYVVVGA